MQVGELTIKMAADIAQLKRDFDEAKRQAAGTMGAMQAAADKATASLKELEGAFGFVRKAAIAYAGVKSIEHLGGLISKAIDGAAALKDLSQQTGASVESLSAMAGVAKMSDTSLQTIGGAFNKLTKSLSSADEDSRGAASAIKALGLSFEDFRRLSPDQQMLQVSHALAGFEDGASKSAVAMALFGKSGAELLPFLGDLAEKEQLVGKVTAEQADMADRYADNLQMLQASGKGWEKQIAMGLLPAMDETVTAMLGVVNGAGGLKDAVARMTKDGTLTSWARGAVTVLSYLADAIEYAGRFVVELGEDIGATLADASSMITGIGSALQKAVHGDFSGAADELSGIATRSKSINADLNASVEAMWSRKTLGQNFRDRVADIQAMGGAAQETKKKLDFRDISGSAGDAAKAVADKNAEAVAKMISDIRRYTDAQALEAQQAAKLTEAQKLSLGVMEQIRDGKVRLTQVEAQRVAGMLEEAAAMEQAAQQRAADLKWMEESGAENDKAAEAQIKAIDQLRAQVDAEQDATKQIGLNRTALALLTKAKLDDAAAQAERNALIADDINPETARRYREQAQALRELGQAKLQRAEAEAGDELRKREAEEWAKTWDQVAQSFTDALMQGGKSVSEYLKGLFRTMVLRPLLQPVVGALGGGISSAASAAGIGPGSSTSSLGIDQVRGLKSVYDAVTGSWSALGDKIAFAAEDIGAWLVNNTSGVLNEAGASLMQNAGAVPGYLGGMAAGYGIGTYVSGGQSIVGSAQSSVALGTAIGAALGGPIGAAVGGALVGAANRVFGSSDAEIATNVTDQGLTGRLSATGASGLQAYTTTQAAVSGALAQAAVTTKLDAVTGDLLDIISGGAVATSAATRAYAQALGLQASAVDAFSQDLSVSIKGLDDAGRQQAIATALSGYGDALAKAVAPDLDTLTRKGETAGQTLVRLGDAIGTVNSVFDTLNTALMQTSLAGADAASKLIDAFGGREGFVQATSSYLDNYYSASERAATTTRQLTRTLADMGLALPADRDAFRRLVEAQDLTTDAGRKTYAQLLSLSGAFASISTAVDATTASATAAADTMHGLTAEIARLRGTAGAADLSGQSAAQLQAQFAVALAQARAGSVSAIGQLPALSQAIERAAADTASSANDVARVRAQLAASLSSVTVATSMTAGPEAASAAPAATDVPAVARVATMGDLLIALQTLQTSMTSIQHDVAGERSERMADQPAIVTSLSQMLLLLRRVTPDGDAVATRTAA